jgi:hypothetical protein
MQNKDLALVGILAMVIPAAAQNPASRNDHADVVDKFGEEIGKNWKPGKFVVYGNPDADTKKALAALQPEYETAFAGFIR